jgi:hypothetical protein
VITSPASVAPVDWVTDLDTKPLMDWMRWHGWPPIVQVSRPSLVPSGRPCWKAIIVLGPRGADCGFGFVDGDRFPLRACRPIVVGVSTPFHFPVGIKYVVRYFMEDK